MSKYLLSKYLFIIVSALFYQTPVIALIFFLEKLHVLTCIDTTNKMYMILIALFILSYNIANYFKHFEIGR